MGYIQKMVLLVLTVPFTLIPGGLITYLVGFENATFEYSMLIPVAMTALGTCAFIFHLKTKTFYKFYKKDLPMPKVEPLFWFLTISFGISFIVVSSYIFYRMTTMQLTRNVDDMMWQILAVCSPMFVFGIWTVVEAFYLHKLVIENKNKTRHYEIDDIKGNV